MRKTTRLAPVTLLALAVGCAPLQLEAPAPDGALECALDLGLEMGYEPVAGGTDAGFIRLRKNEMLGMDQTITVTEVRGTLRIHAAGRTDDDEAMSPSGETKADAERMLAECGGD